MESWLVDFFPVACQFHKPWFSDPCVVCTFLLCTAEVGEPPALGVFRRMNGTEVYFGSG